MTFQFTEDQLSIQEMVRDYAEKEIRSRADEIDKTGRFPKENMDGLRELGVLQLTIPEEYGGTGVDDEITKALAVMEVAVTEPGIGTKGTTAFLVDRSMPGVSCGKTEDKMGIRGAAVSELVLEDVRVPSSAILGKLGEGFKIAMMGLDGGRIGIASQACGVAFGAIAEAVKYSGERVQFGKPINANQGLQWYLADMAVQAEAAWLLTLKAAALRQQGLPCTTAAAMAKWYASEAACYCCDLALQIHGGYGYMKDYPIERMYRDARILRIYEGTSEVQKMVVARAVMKG